MKTKTLLLICLFSGIGLTQLSAQIPPPTNGKTGTVSFWETLSYPQEMIAEDGTVLYVLDATLSSHVQAHYKNGVIIQADYEAHGNAISKKTGEVFKMTEIGKQTFSSWDPLTGFDYFTVHLIGDHGTRLKGEAILDFSTWEYTIIKISWPGDKYWDGD